jgi:hypothetical protein
MHGSSFPFTGHPTVARCPPEGEGGRTEPHSGRTIESPSSLLYPPHPFFLIALVLQTLQAKSW